MKKLAFMMFVLLVGWRTSIAMTNADTPNKFTMTEHWMILTNSFDIESKNKNLGTVYGYLRNYRFWGPSNQMVAIAYVWNIFIAAQVDVYDPNNNLLGTFRERNYAFYPTFDIYGSDGTWLATASMDFWKKDFTLYDVQTDREIATMSRSYYRQKNDWTIEIANRSLFTQRNIDPNVLMSMLAFQGDKEYENNRNKAHKNLKASGLNKRPAIDTVVLLNKIAVVSHEQNLEHVPNPDQKTLERVVHKLEKDYKNLQSGSDIKQNAQVRVNHFVEYCLDVVQGNSVSEQEKKAILFLLNLRLRGMLR
jgi:hypothetical protein